MERPSSQVCRCIICMRTGAWPAHLEDVEEMETVLLHKHEEEVRHGDVEQAGGPKPGGGQ